MPYIFIFLILCQISIGALVSGLDAGKIYTTWPLMGKNYFPDDSSLSDLLNIKLFETASLAQFIHRNIAYLIFSIYLFIFTLVNKNKDFLHFKKITFFILFILLMQMALGIFTILSSANIVLASMHQIGSIILVMSSIILAYKNYKLTNSF